MKYILDVHTHTLASGHAYNTMREMAQAAAEKGLELLGITEHGIKMPGTCCDFYFQNLKMVERQMCGIELLLGSELNIMDYDGTVDLTERTLRELDIVIASYHPPCIRAGSREEVTRGYLKVLRNPYVDIIGHPDDGRFSVDYKELVLEAKENKKLLELNNNSLDPRCLRQNARENDIKMLEYCIEYKQPVVVNSDAHTDMLVGRHDFVQEVLDEMDFPEELVVNRSVEELKKYLHAF